MAQQSSFYFTDGITRTYPSSKHIASKQHVAVYFKSVTTLTWVVIEASLYDLVNNSIVFTDSPDTALYSQIEIRVADTAAELTDSPSDIATVASDIANVNTVATNITSVNNVSTNIASVTTVSGSIANVNNVGGSIANVNTTAGSIANVNTVATNIANVNSVAMTVVPNIVEILLADDNATIATAKAGIATTQAGLSATSAMNAQLIAWEAEAEKMTADSYATEAEDVFVKTYTSDGDGTFTATDTTEYSALHWSIKALANSNFAGAINNAPAKTTPINADKIGIWDSVSGLLRSVTGTDWKAYFKTYFDTLYMALIGDQTVAGNKAFTGSLLLTGGLGIGYGTGSGGTVTQATSKSTTVTLNKPTGTITMSNSGLAPGESVTFTVNCSAVTIADTVIVNTNQTIASAHLNYTVQSVCIGNSNFIVNVKNISAGSLSETLQLNFAVIKGATS